MGNWVVELTQLPVRSYTRGAEGSSEMARRFLGAACVVAAVLAVAALDVVLLAGQAPSPRNTAVKTSSSPSTNYKAPRTAWGDPDLQGNYTNLYEDGTPLERPKEFEGRTLDDVKGAELAKIKAAVQERTINNSRGPIHAPDTGWQDALNRKRGSQAWLIVDPPDGKVPSMTPEAE